MVRLREPPPRKLCRIQIVGSVRDQMRQRGDVRVVLADGSRTERWVFPTEDGRLIVKPLAQQQGG